MRLLQIVQWTYGTQFSRFPCKYPVLAICYKEKTMRHLALSYGVEAIYMPELANGQEYYFAALRKLIKDNVLHEMKWLLT